MMIVETITDEWHFANWIKDMRKQDSSYGNCFTPQGAYAVQKYYDELSEATEAPIEFDPISWCTNFSEYANIAEAYAEHYGEANDLPIEQQRTDEAQQLEWFEDNTTVLKTPSGTVIIGSF